MEQSTSNPSVPPLLVALDTSAVEAAAFDFRGALFRALVHAKKQNRIHLVVVRITCLEIERRIKERAKDAAEALKKAYFLKSSGIGDFHAVLSTFDADAVALELLKQWADFLAEAEVEVLPVDRMNLEPVVEAFFDLRPPFSSKKKNEWRDAIVIERLRSHAGEIKCPVYVCSTDDDIRTACDGRVLIYHSKIAETLALATASDSIAKAVLQYLEQNQVQVDEQLGENFEGLFFSFDDDLDATISDENVLDIENLEYEIIDLYDDAVEVGGTARVRFDVHVEVPDYDASPVDSGEYVFMFRDTKRIEAVRNVEFTLRVRLDKKTREPSDIQDLGIVSPHHFRLGGEADIVEEIEAWQDHHGD